MLEVKNLSFSYASNKILRNISFRALPGEITALIGINGSGKTTALKCISGVNKAQGEIWLNGELREKIDRDRLPRLVSFLEQNTDCQAELNVYEVILLGRLHQLSFRVTEEDIQRVNSVMELLSITEYADRKIFELSGGQRQMVFIAQTLIKAPQILLLDEPTSALDLNKQFELVEFLRRLTRENQYSTVMTLHHLDIAAKFADHIVVVHNGNIYADGPPQEVMTEQMLRDVFSIEAQIFTDRYGDPHIVALKAI